MLRVIPPGASEERDVNDCIVKLIHSQITTVLTIVRSVLSVRQFAVGLPAAVSTNVSQRHQADAACPRGRLDVPPQPDVMTSLQHQAAAAAHASPAAAAVMHHITLNQSIIYIVSSVISKSEMHDKIVSK